MDEFRTRISKVRLKASPNLVVHVLDPSHLDSQMRASFLNHLKTAEAWWPDCAGYCFILTDGDAVTIAANHEMLETKFWALMQYATHNPDLFCEPSDSEEAS